MAIVATLYTTLRPQKSCGKFIKEFINLMDKMLNPPRPAQQVLA
jgi:hypothetical protein